MGLDGRGLDRLLGRPDLVRRDGTAEMRLYRGSACTLHLFLYPQGGSPQARYLEARSRAGKLDAAEEARCLHDVARSAARP